MDKNKISQLIHLGRQLANNDIYKNYCYINKERFEFTWQTLFGGHIKIMLPNSFVEMPQKYKEIKYPSMNRPMHIKTNYRTDINFCFNYLMDQQGTMNVKIMAEYFLNAVKKLNPGLEIISFEEEKEKPLLMGQTIYTKDIAYYEYIAPTLSGDLYYLHHFCFIDNHMFQGIFNCPATDWEGWKGIAMEVFNSAHHEVEKPKTQQPNTALGGIEG